MCQLTVFQDYLLAILKSYNQSTYEVDSCIDLQQGRDTKISRGVHMEITGKYHGSVANIVSSATGMSDNTATAPILPLTMSADRPS